MNHPITFLDRDNKVSQIIVPYVKKMRKSKGLGKKQMALVIMDVFTEQMTKEVKEILQKNNILVTNVPANMARFYQPLHLTVCSFQS